jgi:ribosomal protein S18 acetylase RimI-like enzyme
MSIRRAEPSDAKQIAEVLVAAWKAAYRGLVPDSALDGLSVDDSADRWRERIAKPWGTIFIAQRDHRVVGFAAWGSSQDEDVDHDSVGEIYVIYVHPDEWRQGHGSALAGEALRCLQEAGFDEVILWVLRGNERAIRFYEAQGFAADGASKTKRRADGTKMPVLRYRRSVR